jgi:hypothetical protein
MNDRHTELRAFAADLDQQYNMSESCGVAVEMIIGNIDNVQTEDVRTLIRILGIPNPVMEDLYRKIVHDLDISTTCLFLRPGSRLTAPFDFYIGYSEHVDQKNKTSTLSKPAKRAYQALKRRAHDTQLKVENQIERTELLHAELGHHIVNTLRQREHHERRHLQVLNVCTAAMLCLRTSVNNKVQKVCHLCSTSTTKWTLSSCQRQQVAQYMKRHGGWKESVETLVKFITNLVLSGISFPGYYYAHEQRYGPETYDMHFECTNQLLREERLPPWKFETHPLETSTLAHTDYHTRTIVFDPQYMEQTDPEDLYTTAAHEMSHALNRGANHGVRSGFRQTALALGDARPRLVNCPHEVN